ncbi:MAG: complex I NDUFA9 subunit family protein [Thermodesulfovibrionales bacterium]|nr:complex I NDUFA9 subunit family protein [Thermodesulfovibrionales bacterium]
MNKLFIAGGTGFVGTHLIEALLEQGLSFKCLVRDEKKALKLKEEGIETHIGDITDKASLKDALKGIDIVVHLVGIIEGSKEDFKKIHVEGTENLIKEALKSDIKLFVYQSALGASLKGETPYEKTKALAEELVISSGIPYIIFRPSLIIGRGDGFTKKLTDIIKNFPVIPVPGDGKTRFQPVYIGDWVKAFIKAVFYKKEKNSLYEIGGPEHLSYNEILEILMEATGIRKPIIHIPLLLIKTGLPAGRIIKQLGADIPLPTPDQLKLLKKDNITDPDIIKKNFGFEPLKYREAVKIIFS